MENVEDFIYDKAIQKKLYKNYLKYLSPEEYNEKQNKSKAADKERDKTPKRKLAYQKIDEERDKTPRRKLAHQKIDEDRDKTPKRKATNYDPVETSPWK